MADPLLTITIQTHDIATRELENWLMDLQSPGHVYARAILAAQTDSGTQDDGDKPTG